MIKINEQYCIDADDNNFILKEIGTVQDEKSKNYGEKKEVVLGYYVSLEQALSGLETIMQRRAIKIKDMTLKEVKSEIRVIHDEVFKILKEN